MQPRSLPSIASALFKRGRACLLPSTDPPISFKSALGVDPTLLSRRAICHPLAYMRLRRDRRYLWDRHCCQMRCISSLKP